LRAGLFPDLPAGLYPGQPRPRPAMASLSGSQ
jgi:hypothetical protein